MVGFAVVGEAVVVTAFSDGFGAAVELDDETALDALVSDSVFSVLLSSTVVSLSHSVSAVTAVVFAGVYSGEPVGCAPQAAIAMIARIAIRVMIAVFFIVLTIPYLVLI